VEEDFKENQEGKGLVKRVRGRKGGAGGLYGTARRKDKAFY